MQNSGSDDIFHVLIAGGDDVERRTVRHALDQSGLAGHWEEAASSAEALGCLSAKTFDAALLHFRRAGENGAAFLREAKARGLSTPLILLTEGADEAAPSDLAQADASDSIPKSRVSPESLVRALQNVRRLHRAQMQARQADTARAESEDQFRRVADSNIIGITFWEADGTISDANDAFLAMIGYSRAEMQQGKLNWRALTPPEYQHQDDERIAELARTGVCPPWEQELRRRDGSRVALLISASFMEPPHGKGLAFSVDVTERKRAQDTQKFLAEAGAALSASPQYAQTLAQVARLALPVFADWCAIDLIEDGTPRRMALAHAAFWSEEEAEGAARGFSLVSPDPTGPAQAMRTGHAELATEAAAQFPDSFPMTRLRSYVCAPLVARDRTLGAITFAYAEAGRCHTPQDLALAEQLGNRIALAVDNARFLFDTQARAEREAVVNAIGQTLRASLDVDTILAAATRSLGEALQVSRCFWCWVPAAQGAVTVAPQQYAAPGVPAREQAPRLPQLAPMLAAPWTSADPVVFPPIARHAPGEPESLQDFDTETPEALIACSVPLRGDWSGLLVLEQTGDKRPWTASEAALVRQVGGLLGPALDNARLYEREHRVADMLQAAFLSDIPDRLGDLDLATVYRAGLDESQVGGDCYDVFPLPDGRVALVIADVSGKGLSAAVVTATVKFSLRAFAAEVAAPGLALSRLNRMLCGEASGLGEHFVTLFYAVFDPAGGRLIYASAGHETQVIKRAAGGSTLLGSTGPILGIAEHPYSQHEERLHRGDSLILFTDGLSEARNPHTRELLDIARIAALAERVPSGAGAGALTARLEQLALDWAQGRPHDDMALLVARRVPAAADEALEDGATLALSEDAETSDAPSFPDPECLFRLSFPSRAGHAADVRQAVAHWMETLGYDRPSRDDFLTAVTEAVTNAVLHGSPGGEADEFSVAAFRAAEEHLSVEVVDRGPGLSSQDPSPPMPGPEAVHGRGLPLMREFTDQVEYLPTASGLCVRLHTRRPPFPGV